MDARRLANTCATFSRPPATPAQQPRAADFAPVALQSLDLTSLHSSFVAARRRAHEGSMRISERAVSLSLAVPRQVLGHHVCKISVRRMVMNQKASVHMNLITERHQN